MDDGSRNETCVFKSLIVRSLASLGMTSHQGLNNGDAFPRFHLGIVLQPCYEFQLNDERNSYGTN